MSDVSNCLLLFLTVVARKLLTTTVLLLYLSNLCAQEYSYVHYDVKDGLAGSTVYDITQDKDGFIWFATEAGVSRFDGTHFKNFTTADGLPETEILKVFADSRGRVWITPFKNNLYYYFRGKIYTAQNDSLLNKIRPTTFFREIIEDREGNVHLVTMGRELFTLHTDSSMKTTVEKKTLPGSGDLTYTGLLNNPSGKGILIGSHLNKLLIQNGKISTWQSYNKDEGVKTSMIYPDKKIRIIETPAPKSRVIHFTPGKRKYFFDSFRGSWLFDTTTWTFNKVFLPDKQITRTFIDREENIWFTTHGNGVYKMISEEFRTWTIKSNATTEIFSLQKIGNKLFLGSAFKKVFTLSSGKIDTLTIQPFVPVGVTPAETFHFNRLMCMAIPGDGGILLGFDNILLRYDTARKKFIHSRKSYIDMVKSIVPIDKNTMLVGTGRNVFLLDNKELRIKDTIWPHRCSVVAWYYDRYYIGTPEGLYIVTKEKTSRFLGDTFNVLKYRIGHFAGDNEGNLWVATYGGGLIQMKENKLIRQFTTKDGLPSNICRTLYQQNGSMWVGTDKGLAKINISTSSYPVTRYSTDDGLPSNVINAIYAENDSVYVASPAGVTIFNEKKISGGSLSELKILEVSVNGKPTTLDSLSNLKHTKNSLRFNFVGISFRSGGDILYRYRLKGLNNNWDSTRQTILEFLSLPSGSYELEIIAVNKFGVASKPVAIPFTIATPFWQTLWFKIAFIAGIVVLTWWLVNRRFVAIRKREQEKASLQGRLNDLEQLALRAQMNPHFIFNCLNSIQNFIIHNDLETTNQYLTEFAHLIRQTLDNAVKSTLSIDSEVQYLTRYLEMEKMRFGHSFEYSITVDPHIDQEHTFIPTMILQPYVENSIRHGIRYKQQGKGLIEIKFEKDNNELLCIVQDNGIGREKAATLKSQMHVEYQSKGMRLTEERIKALNRTLLSPVTIKIIDLKNAEGEPSGTRILLHFPTNLVI